ncbi:MAG: CDP-archaeol synthase [Candidatus Auribacterota bacterium]|nr:CDP-archaeol synthase [Candidatus Auribacterota bacterium]
MSKKRIITAIPLILILLGVIYFSDRVPILFFLVGNLFVGLGMREYVRMTDGIKSVGIIGGLFLFSSVFIAAVGQEALPSHLSVFVGSTWGDAVLFAVVAGLFLFQATRRDGGDAIGKISVTLTGIIYVAWLFSFLPRIDYYFRIIPAAAGTGRFYVFFLFLVVKVNDSAAYFIGSKWGKHKLIPRISPGKTIEGAIGGVLMGGLSAIAAKYIFSLSRLSLPAALTLGLVLSAAAVMGDLAESLLKRSSGRKDSGQTLPGMGGILDLLDSLFFTAPLLYFYMKLVLKL